MDIEAPLVAKKAEAGQFIILRVDDEGERIPLTVAGFDRDAGTVRIIFQIVGATTAKLNAKSAGEYISDFAGSWFLCILLLQRRRRLSNCELCSKRPRPLVPGCLSVAVKTDVSVEGQECAQKQGHRGRLH